MSDTTPTIGDRVRGAIAALRNSTGDAVAVETDADGNLRAASPTGRLVVAPGQSIASAWGNSVWDQSVNHFANAGDRANQWPAPNPGSLSFRQDANVLEVYDGANWGALPGGQLAYAQVTAQQVVRARRPRLTDLRTTAHR